MTRCFELGRCDTPSPVTPCSLRLWTQIKPFSPNLLFFFSKYFYYSNRNKTKIIPNKIQENFLIVLENTGSLKWTEATLAIKEITKLDLNKIKNFYLLNDNIKRMTKQTAGWQHFFSLSLSKKGFVSEIHFKIYKSIGQDNDGTFLNEKTSQADVSPKMETTRWIAGIWRRARNHYSSEKQSLNSS